MRRAGNDHSPRFMLVFGVMILLGYASQGWAQEVHYNRDVRPILAENCFSCHGFDKSKREAGLGLDAREDAIAVLDSGRAAIVAGKPEESELVRRILSANHEDVMPPAESGKHLTEAQKKTLQDWIAQGAKYEKHWSFIAQSKPSIAADIHPIDYFVRARLAVEGSSRLPRLIASRCCGESVWI